MNLVTNALAQLSPPNKAPAMDPALVNRLAGVASADVPTQLRVVEGIMLAIYVKADKGSQAAFQILLKLYGDLRKLT